MAKKELLNSNFNILLAKIFLPQVCAGKTDEEIKQATSKVIRLMQSNEDSPVEWDGIKTLIQYRIVRTTPITQTGWYKQYSQGYLHSVVQIQFYGEKAEELANSMHHWRLREDVTTLFWQEYESRYFDFYGDITTQQVTTQGNNASLSYMAYLDVVWYSYLDTGVQSLDRIEIKKRRFI